MLSTSPEAFSAAATRLIKKKKLVSPRHEFFVIQRPEDRVLGPDPVRWIDPLMRHQAVDYRISLLDAAAHHGSSHQAPMAFQVIVPSQMRGLQLGRHRVQFLYQKPSTFSKVNRPEWLDQIKSDDGFAKVAGIELTLLDCVRYHRAVGGIDGAAQIVRDIGGKANASKLARIACFYENSTARRLGYLLQLARHDRQACSLQSFASRDGAYTPLVPSIKRIRSVPAPRPEKNDTWRLLITEPVEVDF
jgi:predicted transcriptional regulator of viral defense system